MLGQKTSTRPSHFPDLEEEKRVMNENILLGFEGERQAGHEQGFAEGVAKGRNEGRDEWLAKGRDEGRDEVTRAERERLALSFMHAGVDVKIISNVTKISLRELKKLKKKFEQ